MIVGFILLLTYTVSLLAPLLWAVLTAFKSNFDFNMDNFSIPKLSRLTFENFEIAFANVKSDVIEGAGKRTVYIGTMLLNSVIFTLISAVMLTAVPMVTAYALTKFDFKLGKIIYMVAMVTFFIPIVGNLPSQLQMTRKLGIFDSFTGLALLKGHFTGTPYFFVFYATFRSLARDYDEAARIDGASYLRVMLLINLPLVWTTVVAVFLLNFVASWNEYTTAMLFLPSYPTVSFGLYKYMFTSTTGNAPPAVLAACLVVCVPTLLLYVVFKNYLVQNLSMGGLKG